MVGGNDEIPSGRYVFVVADLDFSDQVNNQAQKPAEKGSHDLIVHDTWRGAKTRREGGVVSGPAELLLVAHAVFFEEPRENHQIDRSHVDDLRSEERRVGKECRSR